MIRKIGIPKSGTVSARDFYSSWGDINRLYHFILGLAGRADYVAQTAHETLISVERDVAKKAEMKARWAKRRGALDELKRNRQLLLEMILVRHIENFINYLSSILFEIFTARPETLKSSDKVEISKVLEHDSIDSLVREIAELKVDSLSYASFSRTVDFFYERFGITLASEADVKFIHEHIEIRNISVHNRCNISKRFIARMGLDVSQLGKKRDIYGNDIDVIVPKLSASVKAIDIVVRKKLKVKGIRFGRS